MILTRQFAFRSLSHGHEDDLIEAAAGLLDNMDPESRIKAEAEEETDIVSPVLKKVFEAYMSLCKSRKNSIFISHDISCRIRASAGGGIKSEGEDIDVLEMPLDEALRGIDTGRIVDGKTIMLLFTISR